MFSVTQKIPEQYLNAFLERQTSFIKSRVYLFCVLSVGIYFFASITGFMIDPESFVAQEIMVAVFLVAGAGLVLFLNSKVVTMRAAKANAYLFTALVLGFLVKLCIIYADYAATSAPLFVFVLFLVSVVMPWTPAEVVVVSVMHVIAYTFYYLYIVKYVSEVASASFGVSQYQEGIIFLAMAFLLCLVVRRKETSRDIENFILLKEIEGKSTQMRKELELATIIHKTLVPGSISTEKVDIAVNYLPVYYIGGDYAKFNLVGKEKVNFIISDVTGHGVSAALLVNRVHAEFEQLAKEGKEPGVLLKELNEFIKEDFEGTNMYLSAFCGVLDFKEMRLRYSNYGHPPQYIYHTGKSRIQRLPAQTSLLGLPLDEEDGVWQSDVEFGRGDRVLLFTDGITETVSREKGEYGSERLEDFLMKNHGLPGDSFNKGLISELKTFSGGKFRDDIFILNIGIK